MGLVSFGSDRPGPASRQPRQLLLPFRPGPLAPSRWRMQSPDGASWIPGPGMFSLSSGSCFCEIRLGFSPPRAGQGRDEGGTQSRWGGIAVTSTSVLLPHLPPRVGDGLCSVEATGPAGPWDWPQAPPEPDAGL